MQTQTTIAPLYFARSDRNRDLFYTVAAVNDRCSCGQRVAGLMHCTCPDQINRARDCKHVRRVLAGEIRAATPKPAATLRPAAAEVEGMVSSLYGERAS